MHSATTCSPLYLVLDFDSGIVNLWDCLSYLGCMMSASFGCQPLHSQGQLYTPILIKFQWINQRFCSRTLPRAGRRARTKKSCLRTQIVQTEGSYKSRWVCLSTHKLPRVTSGSARQNSVSDSWQGGEVTVLQSFDGPCLRLLSAVV